MSPLTASPIDSQKRLLAALCFAGYALLGVAVMFHAITMSFRGAILYLVLPITAAAMTGSLWGGKILDREKMNTVAQSLLRGIVVAGGAFVIFSVAYVLVLPLVEHGWSLRQAPGLLLLTLTLGILLAAPIVLFGGMLGGATLYLLRRRFAGE
jgi:hypothetical protein